VRRRWDQVKEVMKRWLYRAMGMIEIGGENIGSGKMEATM
jgi:hypothetical protein